jgi:hypothetical protein
MFAQTQPRNDKYTIAGTVIDEATGQTLPGVRLALGKSSETDAGMEQSVFSDPDGKFQFKGLEDGKYRLYAEGQGYPLQGFEAHLGFFLTGIVVGPDQDTGNITFRLHRAVSLSGTVIGENNEPVRDATVMIFFQSALTRNTTMHVADVKTNDLGIYKAGVPVSGTLYVGVVAKPWYAHAVPELESEGIGNDVLTNAKKLDVAYPLTYYSGANDLSSATPILVHYGDSVIADIHLQSVPAVHLHLRSSDGKTIPSHGAELKRATTGGHEIDVPTDRTTYTS